ncbi:DEAD/DEAH box helicase [Enterococcus sp. BWB1-3]|nr:DEAD/DEAH box helicase [Enterococcus sp. BWB1-3]
MGTGKTRIMLELIEKRLNENKTSKVLWITPVSVKKNLIDDIKKHSDYSIAEIENYNDEFVCVVGCESLSQSDRIYKKVYDFIEEHGILIQLVIDEAHKFKNPQSKRVKRLLPLTQKIIYKNELTGTPVTQGLWDIYTQMYMLDPRILKYPNFRSFEKTHLVYEDSKIPRISYMKEQNLIIRRMEPYIFKANKADFADLPPKTYKKYYYDPFTDSEFESIYNDVKNIFIDMLDFDADNSLIIFKMLNFLHQIASGSFRKFIKIQDKFELFEYQSNQRPLLLKDILQEIDLLNNKVIIFHRYISDFEKIKNVLPEKYSKLHGRMKQSEKNEERKKFEESNNILVSTLQCGSTGLNLQNANYIIYYNQSFDYGIRMQSEDRIHRIGQTKNCHIIDILADDTIDLKVMRSINRKSSLVDDIKRELKKISADRERFEIEKRKIIY